MQKGQVANLKLCVHYLPVGGGYKYGEETQHNPPPYDVHESTCMVISALHHFTVLIQYVSSILSIDIQYASQYVLHYHQIGLKPTEICDIEWSFPCGNVMIKTSYFQIQK